MIDTLYLSGGSTKGILYIGVIRSLSEHNLLNNIKNIISCSIGSFAAICISIKININILEKIFKLYDFNNLYDYDNIDIDTILDGNGFFENDILSIIISNLLYFKYGVRDMTLSELYKKTNIDNQLKIFNYTKNKSEYISHLNYPDMNLKLLIKIATCIPILNKYSMYKNNIYIDGGVTGPYPILKKKKYKNYIGIILSGKGNTNRSNNIFDYLYSIFIENRSDNVSKHKRILQINTSISMIDFNISIKLMESMILNGYTEMNNYIQKNKKLFT